ncbi:MAG: homoserine kinase [Candidatus Caldarchaeales archaeon]
MRTGVCRVPSSSANLGPGYDVLSLALSEPAMVVAVELTDPARGVTVEPTGRYGGMVSRDPERNSAARALARLARRLGVELGARIRIGAGIPVGKGLGSSAAEAVGAVFAACRALGVELPREEVARIAASVEPGGHADNAAASTFGGFNVILHSESGPEFLSFRAPERLGCVVVVPDVEKASTEVARAAVPRTVTISDHVTASSRVAAACASMLSGDLRTFFAAVSIDPIVERARADAGVYGDYTWEELRGEKKRLLRTYGVALTISGAGPSRLILFDRSAATGEEGRRTVESAVQEVVASLERRGHRVVEVYWTGPDNRGAVVTA